METGKHYRGRGAEQGTEVGDDGDSSSGDGREAENEGWRLGGEAAR